MEANLGTNLEAWPVREWDFQNLTLAAFYYGSDLELARARWAVADAGKKTARERPNPSVGVVPAYNSDLSVPSPWVVTPTLTFRLRPQASAVTACAGGGTLGGGAVEYRHNRLAGEGQGAQMPFGH